MINNNMKMLKQMVDISDYEEYLVRCKDVGIKPNDLNQFCMGIGTLIVGRIKYPRLGWQEAYLKTFQDMNEPTVSQTQGNITEPKPDKKSCCGGEKKKSPNLLKKGMNLAKSMTDHIITGMKHVESDEYMRRLEICKGCPERLEGFVCSKCGCYMGIKASWAEQKCMLNKW